MSRLVASSTYTSAVHAAARSSNQGCSHPSICTSSPRQVRRARGCCTFGGRSLRGIQRPAAICTRRTVSLASTMPCRAASFSLASVGPKSGYCFRRISATCASRLGFSRLLLGRLRLRGINPTGPWARYRLASLRICRVVSPSRSAARNGFKSPSTIAWMHFKRSSSRMLMVTLANCRIADLRALKRLIDRQISPARRTSELSQWTKPLAR